MSRISRNTTLAGLLVSLCLVSSAQAVVLYDFTHTGENPISNYTGFGITQNQFGATVDYHWIAYFDNMTYTVQGGTESQSFNSALDASNAGWVANAAATMSPNNFGFTNTSNAGGSAGEAGGYISRQAPARGYYSDTTIGTVNNGTDDLYATGTMWLDGSLADNTIYLGWNNPADPANTNRFGFNITEPTSLQPSTGGRIALAKSGTGGTASQGSVEIDNLANQVLYWSLSFDHVTGDLRGIIQTTPFRHPGDANEDGLVNLSDLQILGDNWQSTTATWAEADFTDDGIVNLADLQILGDNWGWGVTPDVSFDEALAGVVIPEPATLSLLLGCSGLLLRRRSR
ncbi:MAG: hypothetical protein IT445_13860 [Phycisphaeraceae bacterium]|nr:hypothetical protein [Phycisphaeraceae bacterium]